MDACSGEPLARQVSRDEVGIFLCFDEDESLVLGIAFLKDLLELLPLVVLGDLVELLLHVLTSSSNYSHHDHQVRVQILL